MSTIRGIVEMADQLRENAIPLEIKVGWIAELDGIVALELMNMDVGELEQFHYDPEADLDKAPLVRFPHENIYHYWLCAKIDAENGEYKRYQNSMQLYNGAFLGYRAWYSRVYDPANTRTVTPSAYFQGGSGTGGPAVTIGQIVALADELRENALPQMLKVRWVGELDALIAADVMGFDVLELEQFRYDPEADLDRQPLVRFPHNCMYHYWLCAKIDAENGEYNRYQNSMQLYNAAFLNFRTWFSRVYQVFGCGKCNPTHYLSAYGLAVQQGYPGTLEQWLHDLIGPQGPMGPQGPQGEPGNVFDELTAEQLERIRGPQGIQGERGAAGGYYTPKVYAADQGDYTYMRITFSKSDETMPDPVTPSIQIPHGKQGPEGPQGEQGPTGPQGEPGPQGPAGEAGPAGPQGPAGADGKDGKDGSDATVTKESIEAALGYLPGQGGDAAPAHSYVFTGTYSSTADASGNYPATLGEDYSYADMLAAINANYDVRCVLWRENGDRPIFLIPSRNNYAGRVTFIGFSDTKQVYRLSLIEDQVKVSLRILTMADGDDLDYVLETFEAFDERIGALENSLSVYSWSFSFTDNGDGTYEVTGGNDYEAILEAYSNGYRVELLTEDGDHRYVFTLAEIGTDYIVFTSPEFEVRHDADGNWQMTKNNGPVSWNELEDKPFGEMPTGGDTLYWDGNTEGLTEVLCEFAPEEFKFYKVSDAVFTDEEIRTMSLTFFDRIDNPHHQPFFEESNFSEDSVSSDAFPFVVFIRKAGAIAFESMGGQVFPEVGVYFFMPGEDDFTNSLTVPNYTGFPSTKRIDEKYLPDNVKALRVVLNDGGTYDTPSEEIAKTLNSGGRVSFAMRDGSGGFVEYEPTEGQVDPGDIGGLYCARFSAYSSKLEVLIVDSGGWTLEEVDIMPSEDAIVDKVIAALPTWEGGSY